MLEDSDLVSEEAEEDSSSGEELDEAFVGPQEARAKRAPRRERRDNLPIFFEVFMEISYHYKVMEPREFLPYALVSQGGGTRGAFTAGVQEVLLKEGFRFSYLIGTSAGALNNLVYLSEDAERGRFVTTELVGDRKFLSLYNYISKDGLFDFSYLFHELSKNAPLDYETMDRSPARYVAVATSLETGQATYFEKGKVRDFWAAIAASASLPFLAKPVDVDGGLYLDGGMTAAIPWRKPLEEGYSKLVVILTKPIDYRKKEKTIDPKAALPKIVFRKYPDFAKAYLDWARVYNQDMEDLLALEQEGKAFIIAPKESLEVSKTERHARKLIPVYEAGVARAGELLPALKEFLKHE